MVSHRGYKSPGWEERTPSGLKKERRGQRQALRPTYYKLDRAGECRLLIGRALGRIRRLKIAQALVRAQCAPN